MAVTVDEIKTHLRIEHNDEDGYQLDWDGGQTGRNAELAVFITLATFRKSLSFAIIGLGQ